MMIPKAYSAFDLAQRRRAPIGWLSAIARLPVSPIEAHARIELFPFLSGIARRCVVTAAAEGIAMLSVLIGILIICVVGAICF